MHYFSRPGKNHILKFAAPVIFALMPFQLAAREQLQQTFQTMGTIAGLSLTAPRAIHPELAQLVRREFASTVKTANLYDPFSELSLLNSTAAEKPFVCSAELYKILKEARLAHKISNGAFDITAKPLLDLWGFYRKQRASIPSEAEIKNVLQLVGLEKIRFDDQHRSVFFTVKGMQLDLGGIAKGYAVDRAMQKISGKISRGIIDLGGNLKIFNPPDLTFTVGIRDPLGRNEIAAVIPVNCGAVSTSGGYERFVEYNHQRYIHIFDPRTGYPATGILAVTVITPLAIQADWMSTAVFIRGETLARELVKRFPGTEIFIYRSDDNSPSGYSMQKFPES